MLHLPFYDASNEDSDKEHRVTWCGITSSSSKAPPGPDGVARAHGFYVVIEATRKEGTKQWSQEFAPSLQHARDLAQQTGAGPQDTYIILVTTRIHEHSFQAVKVHNASNEYKIVPVEVETLCSAVETSYLALTIRHLEARELLRGLLDCLSEADGLRNFRDLVRRCVSDWQKKVLRLEMGIAVAVKSYGTMIRVGRDHVAVSEIFARLSKHPTVKWYLARMKSTLGPDVIARSLVQESLGAVVGKLPCGEELFCPVSLVEFKSRCKRRLQAVEGAHAGG